MRAVRVLTALDRVVDQQQVGAPARDRAARADGEVGAAERSYGIGLR